MTEISAYESGRKVSIPSSWDEMSAGQVREVFRLYFKAARKRMSPLELNVRVLYLLMDLKPSIRQRIIDGVFPDVAERRAENVYMLCEKCLGFLFSEPRDGDPVSLSYDSIRNPLPRAGCRLVGPGELLQDLTFGEFRHAAVALNDFFKSGKTSDLDECITHLYRRRCRKANRAGRRVPAVTQANIDRHRRRVSRLPLWQKTLIMMWFSTCLKYLQEGFVVIDGETVEMAALFSGSSETDGLGYSWNDLLIEISKEQTLGNMDRVEEEPLFSILSIMWHNYKDSKRNEKISKARKSH